MIPPQERLDHAAPQIGDAGGSGREGPAGRLGVLDDLPVVWSAAFTLERKPMPKPRPRARVMPGGWGRKPFAHIYTPSKATREEQVLDGLAAKYAPKAPWPGPVILHVEMGLAIPAAFPKWERGLACARRRTPTARGSGDADNFAKLLQDALSRSWRWWKDDSQVVELLARKVYAVRPGWSVAVYFLAVERRPAGRHRVPDVKAVRRDDDPTRLAVT